jgi:hypothetical protein
MEKFSSIRVDTKTVRKLKYHSLRHEMCSQFSTNILDKLNVQLTYSLTPRSRVLLEKLTGSAASQEIPRIFGTRRFLTVLPSARQLSLS